MSSTRSVSRSVLFITYALTQSMTSIQASSFLEVPFSHPRKFEKMFSYKRITACMRTTSSWQLKLQERARFNFSSAIIDVCDVNNRMVLSFLIVFVYNAALPVKNRRVYQSSLGLRCGMASRLHNKSGNPSLR